MKYWLVFQLWVVFQDPSKGQSRYSITYTAHESIESCEAELRLMDDFYSRRRPNPEKRLGHAVHCIAAK